MSSPVVATVAWLALAVVVVLGAVVAVLSRRLDALTRAHSDRKWEIARLRAEMGALRRDVRPSDEPPEPEPADVDDGGRLSRSWPASPTAWRRGRGHPPVRPRRRRLG
ncbi:hypothetical protein [Pseudonocardia endophytica]|uniref:Uncharacterized protein n=1 Tax=Pseudonocardia endophytica TaxID=401976 RepID=A0A4R1HVQ7_PSEEN|nr:hypothetical protein [Pseudonocardia endophytica]TCK25511.1 hypothetical protein EV378_1320 [Pseudonocardia endophytica]